MLSEVELSVERDPEQAEVRAPFTGVPSILITKSRALLHRCDIARTWVLLPASLFHLRAQLAITSAARCPLFLVSVTVAPEQRVAVSSA